MLTVVGAFAVFVAGCGKESAPPKPTSPPPATSTPTPSAVRTSYNEVAAQLDPGGNFYLYLGTAQWLEGLSAKIEKWRSVFTTMPDATAADTANINKTFDLVTRFIKDSGVEEVTGLGLSSVEVEKGVFHNKALLHHYPGKGDGFLWKLGGQKPHALTGLDYLPTNTALAGFFDLDVPLVWKVVQDEVGKSGFAEVDNFLRKFPAEFEKNSQLKWDALLQSLGGEFGFALTLNESNTIPIPLPGGAAIIPQPGLLIALRVNDATLFDRIDKELKKNEQVIKVEQAGFKMLTMPLPLPFVGELRPSVADTGGWLFIATSDALINEALAIHAGKVPGLKSTAEFKHLAKNIPEQGNSFSFMSERFGQALSGVQKSLMNQSTGKKAGVDQKWLESLFSYGQPAFAYTVGVNTDSGCLTVGNGSQSHAAVALVPLAVVPGLLAAIAIPNFVKARDTSQHNACINNLRQLDAAKNQFSLEKGKKDGDACTAADLSLYLYRGKVPACPKGGIYTIGPIGEAPKCSIPGHELP